MTPPLLAHRTLRQLLPRLLLAWALVLVRLGTVTHALSHLGRAGHGPAAHAQHGAGGTTPQPATLHVCDLCLGGAAFASALPPAPLAWQAQPTGAARAAEPARRHFAPPTRTAFDSRAPPFLS